MDKLYTAQRVSVWKEHFFGLAIVLAFVLPHTTTFFLLVNPLLCLLLVKMSNGRRWSPIVFVPLVPIFISTFVNIEVAQLKAFQSVFVTILYFGCFPFVGNLNVRNGYLYFCLAYIFVSQIIYIIDIPFLTNFFDSVYPIGESDLGYYGHMQNTISYTTLLNYRLGGLYHNPNQCARYLTMLMALFLCTNLGEKKRGTLAFLAIAYIGTLLTGSRTGFVIASLIIYFGLLKNSQYGKNFRFAFIAIALFGLGYLSSTGSLIRGLDVGGGMNNSVGLKWKTFVFYLNNEYNILSLLFGNLDPESFTGQYRLAMTNFDSEYGELIYRYGFVGAVSIMEFWYMVYRRCDKEKRFFFILLLWMVSSTIVVSYRASFIFFLFLSVAFSNSHHYRHGVLR